MHVSPEKVLMLVLFPLITLTLFVVGALLWWFIVANPLGVF